MRTVEKFLQLKLDKRRDNKRLRKLHPESELLDFCSNDYLGFARCSQLQRLKDAYLNQNGSHLNGSTGSRLISGNSKLTEELEEEIAAYHKASSGLIFNSGYNANLGLMACIASKGDTILFDELVHASIHDGMRLSRAKSISFRHNDLGDLKEKIKGQTGQLFVVVESIYSMDGDAAPLRELSDFCKGQGAALIVDEAHATGVIGGRGEGFVVANDLQDGVFARVYTFGKALGGHGAIVLGSPVLRNYLINYARPFIYSTALPPHCLLHIKAAYELLSKTEEIAKLHMKIRLFKENLPPQINFVPSNSAIQSWIIPGNSKVREVAHALQLQGFDLRPIVAPTVPEGKERIRISLHAFNSEEDIINLTKAIKALA